VGPRHGVPVILSAVLTTDTMQQALDGPASEKHGLELRAAGAGGLGSLMGGGCCRG